MIKSPIWKYLSKNRKKQFWFLLVLMIIASFAEVISLGALLPFLAAITSPEQLYIQDWMQPLIEILGLTKPAHLVLPVTIIFVSAALLAGAIRLLLLYVMTRISYATGADLSIDIYRRTLYQDYLTHVGRNSSEVINGIINKTNIVIGGVINPLLLLISSIILIIGIMGALLVVNYALALTAFTSFGLLYLGVIRYTRVRLDENAECVAKQSTQMIKLLQEGLGGVRDVLIDGTQQFYCKLYRNADLPMRRASGDNVFIGGSPKFVMEALGMTIIAVIAYMLTQREGEMDVIPLLGMLALGAQRLLPALQQAYSGYAHIKGSSSSFRDVIELLDQPLPEQFNSSLDSLPFKSEIILKDLSFKYPGGNNYVLKKINLKLNKGSRVGFIGATGSGKSTLIDIIMGLLPPTEGALIIDGKSVTNANKRAWQSNIAHVPQNIYLSDNTIEQNIAFGIPVEKIDYMRVKKAAKLAKISELVDKWECGYQTIIGEQGIKLSGGQRQRIGIARALYKKASILILDEATSALDNETESLIMRTIEELDQDLTILIIAHRLSTLKGCDQIIEIQKDNKLRESNYKEIIDANKKDGY